MIFFPDFAPNSRKEWRLSLFNQFCENKLEDCRKFWNLWDLIQYYSIIFIRVLILGLLLRVGLEVVYDCLELLLRMGHKVWFLLLYLRGLFARWGRRRRGNGIMLSAYLLTFNFELKLTRSRQNYLPHSLSSSIAITLPPEKNTLLAFSVLGLTSRSLHLLASYSRQTHAFFLENVGCICNVVMGREICKSVLGNFHRRTFWRDCGEELSSLEKSWRRTKSLPISKATNRPPRQSLFSGLSFQIWSNLIKFATC